MSYTYLTKKQANVIYAAYKRGDVQMSKSLIREMYDMVGVRGCACSKFAEACSHIINNRIEMAQAELDGKRTYLRSVLVEVRSVLVTEENCEEWPFSEIGDIEEEEIYEGRWVIVG